MDELIKLLDGNLEYVSHEIVGDTIKIRVKSNREEALCPYCGQASSKPHSRYDRSFQDLPMQGKKVNIIINNRKMFCNNYDCDHTTFAESFEILSFKAKKSKRLEAEIITLSLNVSSLTAAKIL